MDNKAPRVLILRGGVILGAADYAPGERVAAATWCADAAEMAARRAEAAKQASQEQSFPSK